MKPERVVAIWVAVLIACVAGLLGSLIPWPAKLREPWSAGDWAAWVQAIGSIAAIFGSAWVARYQMAKQQEFARAEARGRQIKILTLLLGHSANLVWAFDTMIKAIPDRGSIVPIGKSGLFDFTDLAKVEAQLDAVPAIELPFEIASAPMVIASNARRFRQLMLAIFEHARTINADEFSRSLAVLESRKADVIAAAARVHDALEQLKAQREHEEAPRSPSR